MVEHFLTPDCKSGGTPNGRQRLAIPESPPPGVPADLQSAVKKGSTYQNRGICNPPQ